MPFTEAMQTYFRAEKHVGVAMAVLGVLVLAAALWVHRTQSGGFALGLWIPLGLFGLGAAIGGPFLAVRSERQIAEYTERAAKEPAAFLAEETPRMERVNANWPRIKLVWTIGIVIALVLLHVVKREWASGLGLALLVLLSFLFTVDVFAERRAEVYTRALEALRAGAG